MALPSFRDATVVGGEAGLNKIVASVTVLEVASVSFLNEDLFMGNELMITAFVAIKDDVGLQCDVARHLFQNGIVAIAVYYVGALVPKLDKKLIALADELSMPLILMPPNNLKHRYSSAIMEITEAVHYDKLHEKYFVPTLIERVAQIPASQRNLGNVLRMLSDRFHVTIIVADEQMCLISQAIWPSTGTFDTDSFIKSVGKEMSGFQSGKTIEIGEKHITAFYHAIYVNGNQKMCIFTVAEGEEQYTTAPDKNALMQISESIQLIVSMRNYSEWSQGSNQLVNAIMSNDLHRTTQIAAQSDIDIRSISNMWLLIASEAPAEERAESLMTDKMLQLKEFLYYRYKTSYVGSFEESVICLMDEAPDINTIVSAPHDFMNEFCADDDILLFNFSNIESLMDVRKAYDSAREGLFALKAIYKNRSVFVQHELNFALSCQRSIEKKDNTAKDILDILEPLMSLSSAEESIETLSVFLLDACENITQTAEWMHVHPNTVKYRLREIKKKLKVDFVKLPFTYDLYHAVALKRLSDSI